MSTLKSILHHWNSSTSSYDTLHPETEKAQVTDWAQGIVDTLASTALGGLISTLSSDSLMAKLVKLVLDATGVKYLMGTNGYICFGSLFGGLIIQWGRAVIASGSSFLSWTYPLQFSATPYAGWLTHQNTTVKTYEACCNLPDIARMQIWSNGTMSSNTQFFVLVIGA